MYYETTVRHEIVKPDGTTKEGNEKLIVRTCNTFAEAELRSLQHIEDGDVIAIKQSNLREFANDPIDDADIYFATIEDTFISELGDEKTTKYKVALYAKSTTEANKFVNEFMKQGLNDMKCTEIKKTNFIEQI
jgi:hypothetical protein